MKSLSFPAFGLTLAAGLLALSACGKSDNGSPKAASPVAGKAAPAGTVWSEQIVETPDGGYRMGNPDAPLKLIGFASYTCSHCAKFAQEGEAPLIKDYVDTGKLSYEFRNFVRDPLDIAVALLARCNGKASFFPLSNQLFANQPQMFSALEAKGEAAQQAAMNAPPAQRFAQLAALGNVIEFVKQRGLTEDKARACLADLDAATALVQNVEKANGNWSIKGTPAFVLNGALLEDTAEWEALSKHLKDAGG